MPLGMNDTSFSVPATQLHRLATSYWVNPETEALELYDEAEGGQWSRPPAFPSAGGGLVSTVDDYLAFGQMMLDKGRHENERLLSRPSVETMTTDQLTPEQKAVSGLIPGHFDSHGWGFGVSMVTRRGDVAGTVGKFGWDGGLGTSWYFGSQGGHGHHPDDPARLDFPQSTGCLSRLLDLGLSRDRRLSWDPGSARRP